ncbi:hypothetical protein [Streptomyces bambusae]|uniref:C2H2-type domain-containing protein n=1 Tax=Streptomyces bambusae TaxID=1550616 RepID=A0ABS6Z921_9ACTN|nr:hypothetical protein [Streptomyces bambusae]MBW5484256.1 hypothetical protein [Streptomyces bambusae]
MYEMRAGPAGTGISWHVKAKDAATALCGQPLHDAAPAVDPDEHCGLCMASFERAMRDHTARPDHGP